MSKKNTTPQIEKTSFDCPHCGAHSAQQWYRHYAQCGNPNTQKNNILSVKKSLPTPGTIKNTAETLIVTTTRPSFGARRIHSDPYYPIINCNASQCWSCKELTIWIHDKIVYPNTQIDIQPNEDMPAHIKDLFNEARSIAELSPRGAAALLRLCIQHICIELGEDKELNKAIASLVKKGLSPILQKSLDIVRVIGNEAVHPGEIDLNDDKGIASTLFRLVNHICEQMISLPKRVNETFESLPSNKREHIKTRDKETK